MQTIRPYVPHCCKAALPLLAICCLAAVARAADPAPPEKSNAASPALIVTPNQFEGTDVERINRAVQAAAGTGRVVIPRVNIRDGQRCDVWLIDSAILLPSDTTLELDNCHIKLSDRCRDNMIRSANCGLSLTDVRPLHNIHIRGIGTVLFEGADHPRATGDSGKTIGQRTYGTDAGVQGESQTGDWRNIGILLAFVDGFSIENITIKDSHCWAISLERCTQGTLRDLNFASNGFKMIDGARQTILNQDGLDLRLGCHDIIVENVTGYTGDDLVALTAIPNNDRPAGSTNSTMVTSARARDDGLDDIRYIILRNVQGYCRGGHHIVRFLNTPGVRFHDVLLDGLIDTSPSEMQCKAALKIGDRNYGGGAAPLGDTCRLIINNVVSRSKFAILIGGSLSDSIINNVIQRDTKAEVVTVEGGPDYIRNVTITNAK